MDYLLNRERNHLRMVAWDKIDNGHLINAWWRILMEFEDPAATGIIIENHTEGLLTVAEVREVAEYMMREGYDSQKIAVVGSRDDRPAQAIFDPAFATGRGLVFRECPSYEDAVRWLGAVTVSREVA